MTGVGAVTNMARVRVGDTVAIVGLGGVGLNALLGAKLGGAERIIAVDISDDKLGLARQLGATDTFNALDADCVSEILEQTNGGVDFAIETLVRSRRWKPATPYCAPAGGLSPPGCRP